MLEEVKAVIAMLVVQFIFAGMFILFKITAHDGTNLRILVAYRLSFATLFMFPLALIFQRKKRPEFTRRLVLLAFLSGLLGAAIPNILYLPGLVRTSATFSTAASILSPVITLLLSLAFRMDTLRLGSNEGRAKLLGTLLGVGGALVFVFYKGFELHIWSTHVDLLKSSGQSSGPATENHHHISISGVLMVFGCNVSVSLWLLLQAQISKEFGGHCWNISLMNATGSLVCMVVALCSEHNWNQWLLGWNISLLTTVYSGVVVSGLVMPLVAWCIEKKGPLYVTVFSPIRLVIVALVGSFALEETLYLGSLIGAIIMVGGVYLVVWCKMKEKKSVSTTTDHGETNKNIKEVSLGNPQQ
ncbi:PREDICTED: WAT1-related protein At1g25270-like [Brassica oleracea var. oleracea]|uniref:WAT1-related protein At1g25270-like n=1 Tax=Brassica oleracea var. oleracea TaxID=109376 RepID=UPI0006A72C3B|nr:PREDICTED: WAT1-related protein At1g25270-like [Brassica oleracea var. oleracea]